ncbi:Bgt-55093 [Blumeria graminis f. sp. tritici]|uniref:Bgt-55093 n=1 Tax=Blumeria graminis f. sp. tritici TaxID=62690 RepID=A0A9X9MFE9_BLUGR|nr:Bgt-55093 [Blumeria graminis f. sp. tritici]
MTKACWGSQRFFLFSLFSLSWISTVEGRVKVPSTNVLSSISECTHYMSSPNVKLSYCSI